MVPKDVAVPQPAAVDLGRIKKVLAQGAKPAVAAYLAQASDWVLSDNRVSIYFDNKVAFNIVLAERESLISSLSALGYSALEILEVEEKLPEVNLDDFDRQVDLIVQVFRGEKVGEKSSGEKK